MTITAQSIIKRVVGALQDPTSIRWTVPELVRYFNDGQRDILIHRPDASSETVTIALTTGSKQSLPSSGAKLLSVIGNTSGGKRAVTLVDRRILDAQTPGWHGLTGVTEILHYTYDERDPTVFYVYPPAASSGASLQVSISTFPDDITEPADGTTFADVTGNMDLPDIYANPLQDYIMMRCYSKDAEYTANAQRAELYMARYATALGIELRGTLAASPRAVVSESRAQQTGSPLSV